MSDFTAFVQLGFRHIVSMDALDHLLFLLALAAVYDIRDWRAMLWAASAFTIGHSLTLALAAANLLVLSTPVIEFLIPVTIVLTAVANLLAVRRGDRGARPPVVLMGAFGLVHGAGFANYLRSLFVDSIAVPLLGFNVGIELGQLIVLVVMFSAFALLDRTGRAAPFLLFGGGGRARRFLEGWPVPRLRAVALSSGVAIVAAAWAIERSPW